MESPSTIAARLAGVNPNKPDTTTMQTTAFGQVVPSVDHSLNVNGYPVTSDSFLFEKQQTFNRAKTLERMVHPCGSGAFGVFEVTQKVDNLCKADFLSSIGKKTPVFVRFSTVTLGREFPDSARNPRGFAIKFYTSEGNYDIVGLNWPIFFVRDPMKGPDVIRSQQRNPQTALIDFEATFDFLAANPESMHAGTMFFSDRGTPVGWQYMDGFGCHTFKWTNKDGSQVYIKYHFLTSQGKRDFTFEQAQEMCGADPDFAKRNLFEAIENENFPSWKACYQVMTMEEAAQVSFDPFDVTKVWPHSEYPLHEFGKMTLNKNPENFHRDVEESAFSPGSLVPGIEPSPDMLLQFRMFFYRDAQYHRLGVNLHQVPVNCPFMAKFVAPQSRDGPIRADMNGGRTHPYATGTERLGVDGGAGFQSVGLSGAEVSRKSPFKDEGKDSEYDQVRTLYSKVLTKTQKQNLHKNTALGLKWCRPGIQEAYLDALEKISLDYREGVVSYLNSSVKTSISSKLAAVIGGIE